MKIGKNVAVSDSGFLFNPLTGESFSVNPIGAEIMNLLKEEHSIEQISQSLQEKYNTEKTTIEKDIYDFIGILKVNNLIEADE